MCSKRMSDLKNLMWGPNIKDDVFSRWTQGIVFSSDEPTAIVQLQGGPCAVIAALQAYLLKNLLFPNEGSPAELHNVKEEELHKALCQALYDVLVNVKSAHHPFTLVQLEPNSDTAGTSTQAESVGASLEDATASESSPVKRRKISHDQFHERLRCQECSSSEELLPFLQSHIHNYLDHHGLLLLMYSVSLTKGLEEIKREVEDPGEPLIDSVHGHGSQSLINLLLTGRAVSNVWDNDKDVSGLKLQGIVTQANIGFLTLMEHLRYCEVGWYLKNPVYPIWLIASETHLTVLFSEERNLVTTESSLTTARRIFSTFDSEGSGFITVENLGALMKALDLVSESEYVKIMQEKLDSENLGIITLNDFLNEFYANELESDKFMRFTLYHSNNLQNSCTGNKVMYYKALATLLDVPEMQIITDNSPIKTCLMTKWPTIELEWANGSIPSLN